MAAVTSARTRSDIVIARKPRVSDAAPQAIAKPASPSAQPTCNGLVVDSGSTPSPARPVASHMSPEVRSGSGPSSCGGLCCCAMDRNMAAQPSKIGPARLRLRQIEQVDGQGDDKLLERAATRNVAVEQILDVPAPDRGIACEAAVGDVPTLGAGARPVAQLADVVLGERRGIDHSDEHRRHVGQRDEARAIRRQAGIDE